MEAERPRARPAAREWEAWRDAQGAAGAGGGGRRARARTCKERASLGEPQADVAARVAGRVEHAHLKPPQAPAVAVADLHVDARDARRVGAGAHDLARARARAGVVGGGSGGGGGGWVGGGGGAPAAERAARGRGGRWPFAAARPQPGGGGGQGSRRAAPPAAARLQAREGGLQLQVPARVVGVVVRV